MSGILQVSQIQQLDGVPYSYSPRNITVFTSGGIWTRPTWCNRIVVRIVGAGGGGAGHCESGGAGGYSEMTIEQPAPSVLVGVGGGGASIGYYAVAGPGSLSFFGPYCGATGGNGANSATSHSGGIGGLGYGGDFNARGGAGSGHSNDGMNSLIAKGGQSFFGGGSTAIRNTISWNNSGQGSPGSGGAGGSSNGASAGNMGSNGLVIVMEYN